MYFFTVIFFCSFKSLVFAFYDEGGFDPYGFDPYGGDPYGGYGGYDQYGYGDTPTPFVEVESLAHLDELTKETSLVLGLFKIPEENEDGAEPAVFKSVEPFVETAKTLSNRGYSFAVSTAEDVLTRFKVKDWKVYTFLGSELLDSEEKTKKRFTGKEITSSSLEYFIAQSYFPIVGQTKEDNEFSLLHQEGLFKKPICVVYSRMDDAWRTYLQKRVRKTAKQMPNVLFSVINKEDAVKLEIFNIDNFQFKSEEVSKSDFIGVVCRDISSRSYYKMTQDFSAATLLKMSKAIVEGVAKQILGVEAVEMKFIEPEYTEETDNGADENVFDVEDNSVLTLTGGGLTDLIEKLDTDLLLEIYAPWCGHCQSFKADYAKVGDSLIGDNDVIVAKINGDEENLPSQFELTHFPTIYYVKKEYVDKPIIFPGELSTEEVLRFVEQAKTVTKDEL